MQQGTFNNINTIGKKLSLVVSCTLRLSSFGAPDTFICKHGVKFPIAKLMNSNDWSWAKEEHKKGIAS